MLLSVWKELCQFISILKENFPLHTNDKYWDHILFIICQITLIKNLHSVLKIFSMIYRNWKCYILDNSDKILAIFPCFDKDKKYFSTRVKIHFNVLQELYHIYILKFNGDLVKNRPKKVLQCDSSQDQLGLALNLSSNLHSCDLFWWFKLNTSRCAEVWKNNFPSPHPSKRPPESVCVMFLALAVLLKPVFI